MNDYTYKAKKKNKADIAFSLSCYISAAILYGFPLFFDGIKYVPVMQFLALIFIVAGIYINYRYTLTGFVYSVRERGGRKIFGIYKVVGNRSTLAAELPVSECVLIVKTERGRNKNRKNGDGAASDAMLQSYSSPDRYIYTVTMCPYEYYTAVFRHADANIFIRFEPDSALLSLLNECKDADGAE